MTTSEVRLAVRNLKTELENRGVNAIYSISDSTTDFGCSSYLKIDLNGITLKVRASDHSVTNINRLMNEFHLRNNNMESIATDIECIYFPSRFNKVVTISWSDEILYNTAKLNNLNCDFIVINPCVEIKKSGKVMASIICRNVETIEFIKK